jgi:AcrR family transcriptional regulator
MATGIAPRPRLSRAETKEKTHRLLLEAALGAFMRFGYQGATLDRIAAEAGFTKGAIYAHFQNKEALFLELLGERLRDNVITLEALIALGQERPECLDEELGRWIDGVDTRDNLPLLMLELEFESRRNPSFLAVFDQIIVRHQKAIGRIIARYFEIAGRKPPMPVEEMAASIIVMAEGVALARQTRTSGELASAKAIRVLLGMPATGAM